MKKFFSEKWKNILFILLMSVSAVFVLLDVVKIFAMPVFYTPYIAILPILLMVILNLFWIRKKNTEIAKCFYYTVGVAAIEYLGLVLLDKMVFPSNCKIIIYLTTIFYAMIYFGKKDTLDGICNEDNCNENVKKIFSLYYINTEKVYEIAMLLNNKIIIGGTNENELDTSIDKKTDIGISSNLSYLETIKGELGLSHNMQIHNGVKNKVLENFDVKTTKSNMLASIIEKASIYKENENVNLGDLVLLKNASLTLLNQEESYAVTKMILNGAFKDTKISSNSDDMNIEFDLSAMINSLLKDCVYELGCVVGNKKFLLTIPMTFESDFENSYNIYDLQVGSVTVVGIYRGKRLYEKRLSLQEIFSENNEHKTRAAYGGNNIQLHSSALSTDEIFENVSNNGKQIEDYQEVIDVIAVIQEINAK